MKSTNYILQLKAVILATPTQHNALFYLDFGQTRLGIFRSPLDPALGSRPDLPPAEAGLPKQAEVPSGKAQQGQCPTIRREARSRKVDNAWNRIGILLYHQYFRSVHY